MIRFTYSNYVKKFSKRQTNVKRTIRNDSSRSKKEKQYVMKFEDEIACVTFRDSECLRQFAIYNYCRRGLQLFITALPRDELFPKRFRPATRAARLQAVNSSKGRFPFPLIRGHGLFRSVWLFAEAYTVFWLTYAGRSTGREGGI